MHKFAKYQKFTYQEFVYQGHAQTKHQRRNGRGEIGFKCGHCHQFVFPLSGGGQHRNHCPFCLYSRHLDDRRPGDRLSPCGGLMRPIGIRQRRSQEIEIIHRCYGCGIERYNRIAVDDNDVCIENLSNQWRKDSLSLPTPKG
jgi:hypothetical protein